jgi:glyoxylase-like metal-dependent hydrolase (beta-lactamase superfamily II)
MKQVSPGIIRIKERGSFGAVKPPINIYVILGDDGLIYDAGYGKKRAARYLIESIKQIENFYNSKKESINITRLLPSHSHPDHIAGIAPIKDHLNTRLILTKEMYKIMKNKNTYFSHYREPYPSESFKTNTLKERLNYHSQRILSKIFYRVIYGTSFDFSIDEIISSNKEIEIGGKSWKIFSSPGHAPDHISLYNEENGILMSGDNVLRTITTWLGPPQSNLREYISTLKKIKNLPKLRLILPAHGSPITNPIERINDILSHRRQRKLQVMKIIEHYPNKGVSPEQILDLLYTGKNRFFQQMARGWVSLTLRMLKENQEIYGKLKDNKIFFFPK